MAEEEEVVVVGIGQQTVGKMSECLCIHDDLPFSLPQNACVTLPSLNPLYMNPGAALTAAHRCLQTRILFLVYVLFVVSLLIRSHTL